MKDEKALQYYLRLAPLGIREDIAIALSEVSDKLFSTPRHSRTLLQDLQQRGWLQWTPKVGRNQRSTLRLNYSLDEISIELARDLIEQGSYERALEILDNDQTRFSSLLKQTSGATMREGQLHIQLTYSRVFVPLLPHKPLRNSERFLVRQLYSCLTQCDKNGNVTPQLAHHWSTNNEASEWRFFLRPQLSFHSGEPITPNVIQALFEQLRSLPEYKIELAHVSNITTTEQSICFHLTQPDHGFAAFLSDLRYSIQPVSQLNSNSTKIDGSGVFQVIEHSNERLRLAAYDNYFGLRSLTDTVTIWHLDKTPTERIQLGRGEQHEAIEMAPKEIQQSDNQDSSQSRIENGCLYLLFNSGGNQERLTHLQRRYLSYVLSPELILDQQNLSQLLRASVPAKNLLPSWGRVQILDAEPTALPSRLDIAAYDHLVIQDCAKVLSQKLQQLGVESNVHTYSLETLTHKAEVGELEEAIIITSFNVDDNLPISAFRWFTSNAILHHGLSNSASHWLTEQLDEICTSHQPSNYLEKMESIATTMCSEHWLAPLFHHRQTLRWRGVLRGVSITDWSWPDFKNVWSAE